MTNRFFQASLNKVRGAKIIQHNFFTLKFKNQMQQILNLHSHVK
jgi:hypothetical protein